MNVNMSISDWSSVVRIDESLKVWAELDPITYGVYCEFFNFRHDLIVADDMRIAREAS